MSHEVLTAHVSNVSFVVVVVVVIDAAVVYRYSFTAYDLALVVDFYVTHYCLIFFLFWSDVGLTVTRNSGQRGVKLYIVSLCSLI